MADTYAMDLVIGGALCAYADDCVDLTDIVEAVDQEDFTGWRADVWRQIVDTHNAGDVVDAELIGMRMPEYRDRLRAMEASVLPCNAEHWARNLHRKRADDRRRDLLAEINDRAQTGEPVDALIEQLAQHGDSAESDFSKFAVNASKVCDFDSLPDPVKALFETLPDNENEPRAAFPAGRVGMLAAEGGAGKTWAVIQLAVAVAAGGQWLGSFQCCQQGRVLLLAAEETNDEIRRRITWIARRYPTHRRQEILGNIDFVSLAGRRCGFMRLDNSGNPCLSDFYRDVKRFASRQERALIIVDPIVRFACQGTETDNAIATDFVSAMERFTQLPGNPSVLLTHHTAKSSRGGVITTSAAARGSSGLTDGVRLQMNLEKLEFFPEAPELCRLRFTKGNATTTPPPILLRRNPDEDGALERALKSDFEAWKNAKQAARGSQG